MIRLAKLSEIEEIIAITRACAAKMISENIYQWNEQYPNYQAFQKDVEREELYVLTNKEFKTTVDETILGCITISSEKDAEYDAVEWLTEDGFQIYIHRLFGSSDLQPQVKTRRPCTDCTSTSTPISFVLVFISEVRLDGEYFLIIPGVITTTAASYQLSYPKLSEGTPPWCVITTSAASYHLFYPILG